VSNAGHLGSLSNRGVGSPDCYRKPANASCQLGYWERDDEASGGVGCCFGVDDKLDISHPLNFGCVCMFVWFCVVLCVCVGAVFLMVVCAFA